LRGNSVKILDLYGDGLFSKDEQDVKVLDGFFLPNISDGRAVISSDKLHVLQKYHLDISKIHHHLKAELSAMSVSIKFH